MIFVTISYISTNMTGHVTTFQHFNFLVKLVFILTDQFEGLINTTTENIPQLTTHNPFRGHQILSGPFG